MGSLLGVAAGDAFGTPIEGWSEEEIRRIFGAYAGLPAAWPAEARGLPVERRKRMGPLGLHAAATQQALALLNVNQGDGGWCARRWADWLIEGFEQDAWRGADLHFMAAVHRMRKGRDHRGSGAPYASAVPAARVAPLGALHADDAPLLRHVVYESTLVTHGDIRAASVAHAVAATVAALVNGEPVEEIRRRLPEEIRAGESIWQPQAAWAFERQGAGIVPDTLEALFSVPLGSGPMVGASVRALAEARVPEIDATAHLNDDHALLAALHGLAMALRDMLSPDECLADVVRLGGASGVAGAVCGSVLGARFGDAWIPSTRLIDAERLGAYADTLSEGGDTVESQAGFMSVEASFTRQWGAFSEGMVAERRTARSPVPVG